MFLFTLDKQIPNEIPIINTSFFSTLSIPKVNFLNLFQTSFKLLLNFISMCCTSSQTKRPVWVMRLNWEIRSRAIYATNRIRNFTFFTINYALSVLPSTTGTTLCSAVQNSIVQYNTSQNRAIQFRIVQYRLEKYKTVQFNTAHISEMQRKKMLISEIQCKKVQWSALECYTAHSNTAQNSAIQFIALEWSTVQCSTVRCSTVQCSAVQCSIVQTRAMQRCAVQCSAE